MRVTKSQSER